VCNAVGVRQGSLLGWFDIHRPAAINSDVQPPASRCFRPRGMETGAPPTSRPYLQSSSDVDSFDMETHLVSTYAGKHYSNRPHTNTNLDPGATIDSYSVNQSLTIVTL